MHKERLKKKHAKDINIFLKKEKPKGEKRSERDTKILLKKKRKKA